MKIEVAAGLPNLPEFETMRLWFREDCRTGSRTSPNAAYGPCSLS